MRGIFKNEVEADLSLADALNSLEKPPYSTDFGVDSLDGAELENVSYVLLLSLGSPLSTDQ